MKDKEKQFRERVKCGIAYCEDTAVNEIKQDFKMHEEKHKQIEEMAKEIYNATVDCKWNSCLKCEFDSIPRDFCKSKYIAKILVKKYQPKLPEDKVVLSKEEYEKLKNRLEYAEKHWELTVNRNQELQDEIKRLDQKRLELQVDNNMLYLQLDNKSKETAEKIYKDIRLFLDDKTLAIITRYFKEILGVEIKE